MKVKIMLFICFSAQILYAQKKFSTQYTPLTINTSFGVQIPAADLSKRYGTNLTVGGGLEYISLPKGWIIATDFQYLFGQKVKEDVLANMRTPDGAILGDIGTYANIQLRERGIYIGVSAGKLFKFFDNGNRIRGLRFTAGGGFLQHKIRIQDNGNSAPQIAPPYTAGYDRLTNGLALTQFVGYQIVSRDKTINFFIGLDFTEGFTQNRRAFNFDTRQADTKKRLDILYGARVGWSIPLFTNQNADDIEY